MWYLGELINKPTELSNPGEGTDLYVLDQSIDTTVYKDITSVINIQDIGANLKDYCLIRHIMYEKFTGSPDPFWILKDESKQIAIYYCATSVNNIIGYYMMQGMSQQAAIDSYILKRSEDVSRAADCYYARLRNPKFTAVLLKYLGPIQGETFMDAIRNFASDLRDIARLGTNYNNISDGIMDYIESTGSFTNGGLKNYTIPAPLVLADLIKELKDILYYGYTS